MLAETLAMKGGGRRTGFNSSLETIDVFGANERKCKNALLASRTQQERSLSAKKVFNRHVNYVNSFWPYSTCTEIILMHFASLKYVLTIQQQRQNHLHFNT
jgi:hypothetical protein